MTGRISLTIPTIWDGAEPLLQQQQQQQQQQTPQLSEDAAEEEKRDNSLLSKLQYYSLAFGVFVGFFVESGALAIHVLYQGVQWKDRHPTPTQLVSFSLAWATATALLPCLALLFLRTIILLVTDRVGAVGYGSNRQKGVCDNRLQDCLWHLESRFGLGSFFGVSISATIMAVWMGVHRHLLLTALLLTAVTLCFLLISGGGGGNTGCDDNDDDIVINNNSNHDVIEGEQKVAYPTLKKKMDSVDPTAIHAVELKAGSLVIV